MESILIIPARGNSKGVPRKNLFPLAGKPLLFYTVEAAVTSGQFDDIIISSEDNEILEFAAEWGVIPNKRDDNLSEDNVHAVNVVLDYIERNNLPEDTRISMLLPTSPLRTAEDIVQAFKVFSGGSAESVISVYESSKHIMNFRYINGEGYLENVMEGNQNVQRQDMQKLYTVNGSIYISTVRALLKNRSFHVGTVKPYIMPKKRSIDINSSEDFQDVERILNK